MKYFQVDYDHGDGYEWTFVKAECISEAVEMVERKVTPFQEILCIRAISKADYSEAPEIAKLKGS